MPIQKVRYTHDAMIDYLIAEPTIEQKKLAAVFGYSECWISHVINSDAFKERLQERKAEIVDPLLTLSIEDKLRSLVDSSVEILMERQTVLKSPQLALKALEVGTKALGWGARPAAQANVQVNVAQVAVVPVRELDSEQWAAQFRPAPTLPHEPADELPSV